MLLGRLRLGLRGRAGRLGGWTAGRVGPLLLLLLPPPCPAPPLPHPLAPPPRPGPPLQATGAELDPAAFGRLRASLATILGTCAAGSGASPALPRLLQQGGSAAAATSAAAKQQQPVAVGLLA